MESCHLATSLRGLCHSWATRRGHVEVVRLLTDYAHTGKLPQHKLEEYEAVASDFVAAYETGDTEALRRIIEHFQIQRLPSLEEFRKGVRERLVARQKAEPSKEELTLSDAQFLVAGMHGCESWEQITQHGNG